MQALVIEDGFMGKGCIFVIGVIVGLVLIPILLLMWLF